MNVRIAVIAAFALIFNLYNTPAFSKQATETSSQILKRAEEVVSLHEAVMQGDIKKVEKLLSSGANPSERDTRNHGYTPLHIACIHSNHPSQKDIVVLLISRGAGVNVKDGWGDAPLNTILNIQGSKEIALLLINKGADVNTAGFEGRTPLVSAMASGNKDVIKALINNGVNVNKMDSVGRTPLMRAASAAMLDGDTQVMEMLIYVGADVNTRDARGRSLLTQIKNFNSPLSTFSPDKVISVLKTHGAK